MSQSVGGGPLGPQLCSLSTVENHTLLQIGCDSEQNLPVSASLLLFIQNGRLFIGSGLIQLEGPPWDLVLAPQGWSMGGNLQGSFAPCLVSPPSQFPEFLSSVAYISMEAKISSLSKF